jgi:hypothetical protein
MAVEKVQYELSLKDLLTPQLKQADGAANQLEGSIKKVGGVIAGAFAVSGLTMFASKIVSTLSEFEKYDAVLTNTLGSGSESKKVLSDITEFAAKTPFQVAELTGSFVKLANMGFKPTNDEMTKLGDLASSTGKGFDQLSEAVIDAQTGEFERLKEFGIRASKQGDQVQFSFKGVTKTVQNTETSIQKYLLSLGELNGVSGAMAAISETTGGKLSNLEDNATSLYLTIGESLKPVISDIISGLSGFIDVLKSAVLWMVANKDTIGLVAVVVGGAAIAYGVYTLATNAAAIGTTIWTATQWLLNAALTANPIGIVVVAIGALIAGVIYAYQSFGKFRGVIWAVWAVIKEFASIVIDVYGGIGKTIMGVLTFNPKLISEGANQAINAVKDSATRIGKAAKEGYDAGMADFDKDQKAKAEDGGKKIVKKAATPATPAEKKKDTSPKGATGTKAVTINITIGKLIEQFKITTTNLHESTSKVQEMVANTLLQAVNDSSIQAGI